LHASNTFQAPTGKEAPLPGPVRCDCEEAKFDTTAPTRGGASAANRSRVGSNHAFSSGYININTLHNSEADQTMPQRAVAKRHIGRFLPKLDGVTGRHRFSWRAVSAGQARRIPHDHQLGQLAPDFEQDSTAGKLRLHDYLGGHWGVLFSHPKDYTPVCTSELAEVARLKPEWDERHVKPIGLSVDSGENH
jgi:hypothetical protein